MPGGALTPGGGIGGGLNPAGGPPGGPASQTCGHIEKVDVTTAGVRSLSRITISPIAGAERHRDLRQRRSEHLQ